MIITRLKGGMGNQMFQYAIGRALSIKYNTSLGLDLAYLLDRTTRPKRYRITFRNYDLDIFNVKAEIVPQSDISFANKKFSGNIGLCFDFFRRKILKLPGVDKGFNFDKTVLSLGNSVYLDGWWQSPKYFSDIEDIIRNDFTLKKPLPINIQNLLDTVKKENSLCVHIRRGDFVGNSYHDIIGDNYYKEGVDLISKKTKIDKIYVFSDDIKWCRENMKFEFPTMFVDNEYSGKKAEGHLILMSACRYFIIPNSTFAWWGAWLSDNKDKIVIAPKLWFKDENINTDDLIPKQWIRI